MDKLPNKRESRHLAQFQVANMARGQFKDLTSHLEVIWSQVQFFKSLRVKAIDLELES